ncbi:hypothetical protein PsAD37_02314 [Pseudovibrio sp. Ad37]|nr:hypothetical protein PsAD37_02314 [Pseudovibrio sp. Ad37]
MSSYLYICANQENLPPIKKWLKSLGASYSTKDNIFGLVELFIAADAPSLQNNFSFLGYAINDEKQTISFDGSDVLPTSPQAGCYLQIQSNKLKTIISSDVFAQVSRFYFSSEGICAVSDSLAVLAELRRAVGIACKPNIEALLARSWINGITQQQTSHQTIVQDIVMALPGEVLKVRKLYSPKMSSERATWAIANSDYEDTLRNAAQNMIGFIWGIHQHESLSSTFNLSGGLDSRTVLAAAIHLHDKKSEIDIKSNIDRPNDFAIAKQICNKFNLSLNNNFSVYEGDNEKVERLANWYLCNAGTYDPLHSPAAIKSSGLKFEFGGHGAELYKGNYGWRSVNQIGKKLQSHIYEAFLSQSQTGLMRGGINAMHEYGSEWHYLFYRNSIHAGRSTMTSLHAARPLLNKNLVSLTYSPINPWQAPGKGQWSIVNDILVYLSPTLAVLPFDDERKNMSNEQVTSRHNHLGSLRKIEPYKIVGQPKKFAGKPLPCFLQLASQKGFSGGLQEEKLARLCRLDMVPSELQEHFSHLLIEAEKKFHSPEEYKAASKAPSVAVGKLLSMHLFS